MLWSRYTTTIAAAETYRVAIRGSGIFYTYVDGTLLPAATERPQQQNTALSSTRSATHFAEGSAGPASRGATAELSILSVAMGLANGGVGPQSHKGITGNVSVNGAPVTDQAWGHHWMMSGEHQAIFTEAGTSAVTWQPAGSAATDNTTSNVWFRARFDLPAAKQALGEAGQGKALGAGDRSAASTPGSLPVAPPPPAQLSHALHLLGMNKGVAYVNVNTWAGFRHFPRPC
jgi:hypothetical protein